MSGADERGRLRRRHISERQPSHTDQFSVTFENDRALNVDAQGTSPSSQWPLPTHRPSAHIGGRSDGLRDLIGWERQRRRPVPPPRPIQLLERRRPKRPIAFALRFSGPALPAWLKSGTPGRVFSVLRNRKCAHKGQDGHQPNRTLNLFELCCCKIAYKLSSRICRKSAAPTGRGLEAVE